MISSLQPPFVTLFYLSLASIGYVGLAFWVIQGRFKTKTGLGTGGHDLLERRIRVHGNAAEYLPLGFLLLAFCELCFAWNWQIHVAGSTLLLGRILHAIGLNVSRNTSIYRFLGMMLTFVTYITLAFCGIWNYLNQAAVLLK